MEITNYSKVLAHKNEEGVCAVRNLVFIQEDMIASCGYDFEVKVWDLPSLITGKASSLLQSLKGHTDNIRHLYYSQEMACLVSCSNDCSAIVWKKRKDQAPKKNDGDIFFKFRRIYGFYRQAWAVLYKPRYKLLLIGHDSFINMYRHSAQNFRMVKQIVAKEKGNMNPNVIYDLKESSGSLEIWACGVKHIYQFNIFSGVCLAKLDIHDSFIYRMHEMQGGSSSELITVSEDRTWTIFDRAKKEVLKQTRVQFPVCAVASVKELNLLVFGLSEGHHQRGIIAFCDSTSHKTLKNINQDGNYWLSGTLTLLWSNKYQTLLSGHWDGFIRSFCLKR